MTPGKRARFNSTITARQKVTAILDERLTDPHERVRHGLPEERKDKPDKEQRFNKEEREQELRDEGAANARQEYERIEEENERLTRIINSGTFVDYTNKTPREIAEEELERMLKSVGSSGRTALSAVVNIARAVTEIAQERLDEFEDEEEPEPAAADEPDDDGPDGNSGGIKADEPETAVDPEHATPPGMLEISTEPDNESGQPGPKPEDKKEPPPGWERRNSLSYEKTVAPFQMIAVYRRRENGWNWFITKQTRMIAQGKGASRVDAMWRAERELPASLEEWQLPRCTGTLSLIRHDHGRRCLADQREDEGAPFRVGHV